MVGCGIAELGTERRKIAGDAIGRNGGSGFDGDVFAGGAQRGGEFAHILRDHRFAAGEHAMRRGMFKHFGEDLVHGHFRAFRFP